MGTAAARSIRYGVEGGGTGLAPFSSSSSAAISFFSRIGLFHPWLCLVLLPPVSLGRMSGSGRKPSRLGLIIADIAVHIVEAREYFAVGGGVKVG